MTKIKLCGISRPEDIMAVNQWKPDYIGFVFYKKSVRCVSPENARRLKEQLLWSYVKKKYKLNVPNFHVPAGQVSLQEPQQILPLLSDILLRTD